MVGGHHGECGARAYNGVWEQSLQRGPGAEPLVRGPGGRSPPEAESILVIKCPTEPANLALFLKCPFILTENSMLCYGPLVSELGGGQSAWCPQPVIGGLCPPGRRAYDRQALSTARFSQLETADTCN